MIKAIKRYLEFREPPSEGYTLNNYGKKLFHKDAVFFNGYGQRLTSQAMRHMMKRYSADIGLNKNIYCHLWRSSTITLMDENGMSRSEIAKKSGHRNLQSLDTYLNPRDEVVNKKYHKALSLEPEEPERLCISSKEDKPTNKSSNDKKEPVDKTEKYIALLQEGHITKADFMKLISKEQDYSNSYFR